VSSARHAELVVYPSGFEAGQHCRRLTPEAVRRIREIPADRPGRKKFEKGGGLLKFYARLYDVSVHTIADVRTRRTWRWVK
jgi:uncharacterized cysteine cluster protein YcgN (CxxCxxCC family)